MGRNADNLLKNKRTFFNWYFDSYILMWSKKYKYNILKKGHLNKDYFEILKILDFVHSHIWFLEKFYSPTPNRRIDKILESSKIVLGNKPNF